MVGQQAHGLERELTAAGKPFARPRRLGAERRSTSPTLDDVPPARHEELPRSVEPMLASAGSAPTDKGRAMEVKWDGIRAQVAFNGRSVAVRSRPGRILTDQFPELQELGDVLGARRVVVDGELVCLGTDGKPNFAALVHGRRKIDGQLMDN